MSSPLGALSMDITIKGIEFESGHEAIQHTYASGRGEVIRIGGRLFVVEKAEADRLAAEGVEFAYLVDHELPDGTEQVMTIPVND